jgi:CheY-like chemotaxis protein
VDLVISDVNMPRMDGITLVSELRALPSYRLTPLLLLTTESSREKKMEGKRAGATGWIVKPFNPRNSWRRSRACCKTHEAGFDSISSAARADCQSARSGLAEFQFAGGPPAKSVAAFSKLGAELSVHSDPAIAEQGASLVAEAQRAMFAMQYHDQFAQRVQHVRDALGDLHDALAAPVAPPATALLAVIRSRYTMKTSAGCSTSCSVTCRVHRRPMPTAITSPCAAAWSCSEAHMSDPAARHRREYVSGGFSPPTRK